VIQVALFTFVVNLNVHSHQINESNSIFKMMIRVYKEEIMMLVFILALNTFSRVIYEASFVLGFFLTFMKKN
jgi:hypothetical protein